MPRKRPRDHDGQDDLGRQPSPPHKVPKPTVAANAQDIAILSEKMSGVDNQLSTMNSLLAHLASEKTNVTNLPDQVANASQQSFNPQTAVLHASNTPAIDLTAAATNTQAANYVNTPSCPPAATLMAGASHLYNTAPHYTQVAAPFHQPTGTVPRARHHTAGPECQTQTTSPPVGHPAGIPAPTAWTAAPVTGYQPPPTPQPTGGMFGPPPPTTTVNPWDHPTTLQDLEADTHLTRWVAEALHVVATPFAGQAKSTQFPHFWVTQGPKKQKTNLGELSFPD